MSRVEIRQIGHCVDIGLGHLDTDVVIWKGVLTVVEMKCKNRRWAEAGRSSFPR